MSYEQKSARSAKNSDGFNEAEEDEELERRMRKKVVIGTRLNDKFNAHVTSGRFH